MAAEKLSAPGGVAYCFRCTSGGVSDSGWQAEPEYLATGLQPETEYTFVAEARDGASGEMLRATSEPVSITTRKADEFDAIMADEIELIPVMVGGPKDKRINIVVVNRWREGERDPYNRPELRDEFVQHVRDCIEPAMTLGNEQTQQPFAEQRSFYNVYALWWPSMPPWDPAAHDRGEDAMHWEIYNEVRARLFLPWQREGKGWVTHLAMVNSRGGGGGAGLRLNERVGDAMIEGNEIEAFFHEFSHTALRLGDKYIGWGCWGRSDESSNTTLVYQRDQVKWRAWIAPDTPVPTPYNRENLGKVGLFEGGLHRPAYIFRSTPVCTMGVNQFATQPCVVCIQEAAQRTYDWVDVIENPRPARESLTLQEPGAARFSIDRVKPDPDTHKVSWHLNGLQIAEGVDAVEVELGAIGEYEVVCSIVDETELIREDPPFARSPRAERRWRIVNPNPTSKARPLSVVGKVTRASWVGVNNGEISAQAKGGKPPHAYCWSTGATRRAIDGLAPGVYQVRVVDSEFRTTEAAFTVARPVAVPVEARSVLTADGWDVTLAIGGDEEPNVKCSWSTGARGLVARGLPDGDHSYRVKHASGEVVEGRISLARPDDPLTVRIEELAPSTGANNGQIRLGIAGGRDPHVAKWADDAGAGLYRDFLPPGDYSVIVRDANRTTEELVIAVGDEPDFLLDRPHFEASPEGARIANPEPGMRYLWYGEDWPLFIQPPPRGNYEGTFTAKDGTICAARGAVIANTNGKWVNSEGLDPENNRSNNDFGSWVRLDAFVNGRRELPLTVKLQTGHGGESGVALDIHGETRRSETTAEICAEGIWKGTVARGRLSVDGEGPDVGRFELLYTARHENVSRPLHVGPAFRPDAPGTYFVAAQREDTGAISTNRVGVAITLGDAPIDIKPRRPDEVEGSELLLWLDVADLDGDGVEDDPPWGRGSVLGWRGKPGGFTATSFLIHDPNQLNGKGIANWQYMWIQSLEKRVSGYQTLMMVYRDHELSAPGTGPFAGVGACLWDLTGDDEAMGKIAPEFRDAKAWLDGVPVDPQATAPPMDCSVVTFELAAPAEREIARTEGEWEGSVAEIIAFDGPLSDEERRGVEQYLRHKWTSEVHLPGE